MKKLTALLLALCLLLSLCACGGKAEEPAPTEAIPESMEEIAPAEGGVILFTNDVHCGVTDNLGYEGLALVKETLLAQGENVLLVDCGDAVQGGVIGTVSEGEYIINIMNRLGYDAMTLGNHEFDYGMERFEELRALAEFPMVCCNITDTEGGTLLDPYVILELGGAKIAFVGISTPQTLTTSTPVYFQDENGEWKYSFSQDATGEKLYAVVQSAVDAARAEGAEYVVALAHLGIEAESSPWMSTEVITHTTGIDAVLDAHSHSVIEGELVKNAENQEVLLASTGTKLANIGCLRLSDGKFSVSLINNNGMSEYIDGVESDLEALTEQVVAHTDVDLLVNDPATGERMVRSNECNLGDLCADAIRAYTGADIALINGGNIRADIPAGDITYGQIITVMPFGNQYCTAEISGADILDALELSVYNLPGEFGGFLQVSGISFTVDMSVESTVVIDADTMFAGVTGEHRVKDVYVGDEPLDTEKTYIVGSTNYILKELGNGYCMFAENGKLLLDCVALDSQGLAAYITETLQGSVGEEYEDVYGDGRITIING